jgi:hypothetical protein
VETLRSPCWQSRCLIGPGRASERTAGRSANAVADVTARSARRVEGQETSNLLLALARAARLGQAFAHCSLTAWPLIPFHFTLDQNIKRDPFKSEDLESKTYSVHFKPGGALQIPHQSR